ncbi:MAG: hypothetical protein PVSMB1_03860 [Gemmatimonadaceae bacterium]
MTTVDDPTESGAPSRRSFLRAGVSAVMGVAGLAALPGCAPVASIAVTAPSSPPRNRPIESLDAIDVTNGGADPFPIPWLDKNGSHNQPPGPDMEPSNIFHFGGKVARSNDFTGMGTDNQGRRIAFGSKSTDFSFMSGEYFAGRQLRRGAFGHI